jgi:hypothetical protein
MAKESDKPGEARPEGVEGGCPLPRERVIDAYFIEHRAKLLDVAAFLDRVERAAPLRGSGGGEDFRVTALRRAIEVLARGGPERARRLLELWSDPSVEPIDRAPGKGASGAFPLD